MSGSQLLVRYPLMPSRRVAVLSQTLPSFPGPYLYRISHRLVHQLLILNDEISLDSRKSRFVQI